MRFRSQIRDLIPKLDQVAREHACYSQVYDIMRVALDHMAARARIEELHQEEAGRLRGQLTPPPV